MRVLLTDNRTKTRAALKRLLEQEPEVSVVGEVAGAEDLLAQVQETRPDLVLLDWELSGLQATDLLSALHSLYRPLKVIAFSRNREARQEALAAGADAFVSREEPLEWLLITLHAVGGLSPCFVG
jgi:DNA-binding NarL/FixJ family response regulator